MGRGLIFLYTWSLLILPLVCAYSVGNQQNHTDLESCHFKGLAEAATARAKVIRLPEEEDGALVQTPEVERPKDAIAISEKALKALGQRFTFVRSLGSGGIGKAWLVIDQDGRKRVLKWAPSDYQYTLEREHEVSILLADDEADKPTQYFIETELVRFQEDPQGAEQQVLVMDYLDGSIPLSEALKTEGLLSPSIPGEPFTPQTMHNVPLKSRDLRRKILQEVGHAINRANRAGVRHGDIKASNILVTFQPNGEVAVKIIDWGSSQQMYLTPERAYPDLEGTPRYMGPDQMMGKAPRPGDDFFGLSNLAAELAAGRSSSDFETDETLSTHTTGRRFGQSRYHTIDKPLDLPGMTEQERLVAVIDQSLAIYALSTEMSYQTRKLTTEEQAQFDQLWNSLRAMVQDSNQTQYAVSLLNYLRQNYGLQLEMSEGPIRRWETLRNEAAEAKHPEQLRSALASYGDLLNHSEAKTVAMELLRSRLLIDRLEQLNLTPDLLNAALRQAVSAKQDSEQSPPGETAPLGTSPHLFYRELFDKARQLAEQGLVDPMIAQVLPKPSPRETRPVEGPQ